MFRNPYNETQRLEQQWREKKELREDEEEATQKLRTAKPVKQVNQ